MSVFAKIVLWFFATLVITLVAVDVTTALTFTAPESRQSPFTMLMNAGLERAVDAYEEGGPPRLAASLARFQRAKGASGPIVEDGIVEVRDALALGLIKDAADSRYRNAQFIVQ